MPKNETNTTKQNHDREPYYHQSKKSPFLHRHLLNNHHTYGKVNIYIAKELTLESSLLQDDVGIDSLI